MLKGDQIGRILRRAARSAGLVSNIGAGPEKQLLRVVHSTPTLGPMAIIFPNGRVPFTAVCARAARHQTSVEGCRTQVIRVLKCSSNQVHRNWGAKGGHRLHVGCRSCSTRTSRLRAAVALGPGFVASIDRPIHRGLVPRPRRFQTVKHQTRWRIRPCVCNHQGGFTLGTQRSRAHLEQIEFPPARISIP